MKLHPVREIYGHNEIETGDMSIDHFVPWSYVAHDELWNLHPTTRSINSSKSNNLPDWDIYFPELAKLEYLSYEMIWANDAVHSKMAKTAADEDNIRVYIPLDINHRAIRRRLNAVIAVNGIKSADKNADEAIPTSLL